MVSSLFLLIPIIAVIVCVAIAASWPHRGSKFTFMAFVTVSFMVSPLISSLFSWLLQAGFQYNSISWLHYVMQFCNLLSLVLLVIFAVSVRFAFDEIPIQQTELGKRKITEPSWNTGLDARQVSLISTKRNLAFLVDSLPLMLACVAGVYSMGIASARIKGSPSMGESAIIFAFAILAFVGPIYMVMKDAVRGRGFGKSIFDCRVVIQSTGQPAGFSDSILRNLMFVLPFGAIVELITSMVRSDGRRLGDLLAKTQVVFGPPDFIDGVVVAAKVIEERHPLDD